MAKAVAILFFSCAQFVFTERISNMQLCCPLERILFLFGKYLYSHLWLRVIMGILS